MYDNGSATVHVRALVTTHHLPSHATRCPPMWPMYQAHRDRDSPAPLLFPLKYRRTLLLSPETDKRNIVKPFSIFLLFTVWNCKLSCRKFILSNKTAFTEKFFTLEEYYFHCINYTAPLNIGVLYSSQRPYILYVHTSFQSVLITIGF